MLVYSSPLLIAVNHALRRLLMPRHPPHALSSLFTVFASRRRWCRSTRFETRLSSRPYGVPEATGSTSSCNVIDGAYTSVPDSSRPLCRGQTLGHAICMCVADFSATLLVNLSVTASAPKPCALRRSSSDCRQSHLIAVQIFNERSFHTEVPA